MADFHERLSELIKKHKVVKKDLIEFLGMKYRNFHYYETGKHKPNPEMIVKIAQYFEVSTAYLLGIEDEPTMIAPNHLMRVLTPADARWLDLIYKEQDGVDLMLGIDESEFQALVSVWRSIRKARKKGDAISDQKK